LPGEIIVHRLGLKAGVVESGRTGELAKGLGRELVKGCAEGRLRFQRVDQTREFGPAIARRDAGIDRLTDIVLVGGQAPVEAGEASWSKDERKGSVIEPPPKPTITIDIRTAIGLSEIESSTGVGA
jgi:hypothetical protein